MSARFVNAQIVLLAIPLSIFLSGCGDSEALSVQIDGSGRQPASDHEEHDDHDHDHHIADHRPDDYADLVRQLESRPALIHAEADHDMGHAAHELEELRDIIAWLPEIAADTDLVKRDWDVANLLSGELNNLVPARVEAFLDQMKPGSDGATEYQQRVSKLSELIPLADQN